MSNLRLAGLASGMDTDAMVQSLMKVERMKVDRFEQSRQIALWRQEQYNSINKMFANFILNTKKDIGLNQMSITGGISNTNYTRLDYIRRTTSSNEGVANVSSTSQAMNGSFNLDISSVAKAATLTSAVIEDDDLKGISDFIDGTDSEDGKSYREIRFSINGDEIVLSKEVESEDEEVNFTINDIIKAINNNKGKSETTAFYDKNSKRLFIQGYASEDIIEELDEEGFELKIRGEGIAGEKLMTLLENGTKGVDYFTEKGTVAEFKINGLSMKQATNNIKFNGLNIEAKSIGTTTIKVDTNVQGIYDKIEKLVNDYNELIDKASSLLGEKRYPSYHPLSMEEKKAMHEDDVKLWEERAKSGLLNNDETIQRALQNARNDIYKIVENVNGSFNHITQIGITTEKYARGSVGGKLQIDKDKLMNAIMEDPEGVMELLFTEPSSAPNKPTAPKKPDQDDEEAMKIYEEELRNYKEELRKYEMEDRKYRNANGGIFTRVYDNLIDGMRSIIDKSGPGEDADLFRSVKSNMLLDFVTNKSSISDIDKSVMDMNKRIDDLNAMLFRKENAYYAKFANMEKMLHQMYSQSDWLGQQFIR